MRITVIVKKSKDKKEKTKFLYTILLGGRDNFVVHLYCSFWVTSKKRGKHRLEVTVTIASPIEYIYTFSFFMDLFVVVHE